MEQRSAQEMCALLDVAYVVCYGHFPNPDSCDSSAKPRITFNLTDSALLTTPPNSPLDESNPFSDDGNPFPNDGTPSSDEGNPFAEDTNPFSDKTNGSVEDQNPCTDESNPFGDDEVDSPTKEESGESDPLSSNVDPNTKESKQDSPSSINIQPAAVEGGVSTTATNSEQSDQNLHSVTVQELPRSITDPASSLVMAVNIVDTKEVSQSHAIEILAEAFNLTKLDLTRLVEEARYLKTTPTVELFLEEIRTEGLPVPPSPESYPILFLRAKIGDEETFTNFSSTSATNTILQSLTLGIQNMYNDTLSLEVWSANVMPIENAQPAPKMDFLGRIMTGSIRLKKNDSRNSHTVKLLKDTAEDECSFEREQDNNSQNISPKLPSPKATQEHDTEINGIENIIQQNGHYIDDEGFTHSHDTSDSISVTSEASNDMLRTSTPRGRSSSLQHLESTNTGDGFPKKSKGLRSSIRMKANYFTRSSQSNLKKSNQSLSAESASPNLSLRAPDTHSIQSETGDISQGQLDYKKTELDRETSRSTLSITSLTRRTFSMRLSTKKATNPLKKFGSMRIKKSKEHLADVNNSNSSEPPPQEIHNQSIISHNESPNKSDAIEMPVEYQNDLSQNSMEATVNLPPKVSSRKLLTPRSMRPFRSLKINFKGKSDTKDEQKNASPEKSPVDKVDSIKIPDNPEKIQKYLSSIGKGQLKAERIAIATVPIKSVVGEWLKEGWIPMTLVSPCINDVTPQKDKKVKNKKKGNKLSDDDKTKDTEKTAKVLCRMHVRLALPVPSESDLNGTAFESYNATYKKLVHLKLKFISDITDYKGDVGVVGDIVLNQLAFFSRVSVCHRKLVSWLVLAEKKPSDATLLLPFLTAIRDGLHEGKYITAQKLKVGESLSKWVRYVMPKEFELLHSSFPCSSHILHLPRLENFLRCFHTIEEDSELRILFEREMNLINLPSLTDQLKGALVRNAEIWIEALNKEPVVQETTLNLEATETNEADTKWHDALRRAAHLTKPIDDFLAICVHTYQPIFMTEMTVDYLYWVLPKFLTAALHLINKTHRFPLNKIQSLHKNYISSAASASWKILNNLSSINRIGVDTHLPIHLIEQNFRTAYSNTVLQWLTLSELLSLEELENDLQKDDFVALDPDHGFSHSAVCMVDILKAIMARLKGLCWSGGLRPGVNTLSKIAKHIISLVNQYTNKVTHVYTMRGGNTDRIPTQVCVVVRNVEHVCDEARQHLNYLASWAKEEPHVKEELPPEEGKVSRELDPDSRDQKLQRQIDFTAEILLQRCLPRLEQILTQGVSRDCSDHIIRSLEMALQPIEDRLYFAEPLLYELWSRLYQHALHLKGIYIQGQWRDDVRRLQRAVTVIYNFLTDKEKVGFQLQPPAVIDYEELIDELKMLGASSPGLIAKYYNERYIEQCKEIGSKTTPEIIANITMSREGLRVYIAQAPGNTRGGVIVKARVEPQEWFPNAEPLKTKLVKAEQAVFDETLVFPNVQEDSQLEEADEIVDVGGFLILQIRTPKLFTGSIVHHEAILPLAVVPKVREENRLAVQHTRLPLTRPWSFGNYRSLEVLRNRVQDQCAMDFLKVLHTRWEGSDESTLTHDTLKVNTNFLRAGSFRLGRRRSSTRDLPVK